MINTISSFNYLSNVIVENLGALSQANPSIAKITTGISCIFTGSFFTVKSHVLDRLKGKNDDPVTQCNYKLAASGGLLVISGLAMTILGVSELYSEVLGSSDSPDEHRSDNLCDYRKDSLCESHLGITRDKMPQLAGAVKEEFLTHFDEQVSCKIVNATDLRASQSEIYLPKIEGMLKAVENSSGAWSPCREDIIVANGPDNKLMIVDGHHRAAACFELGGEIPISHINADIASVLKVANVFKGVEHHSFTQGY